MEEIRLHGLGGQGVVKASRLVAETYILENGFAQFIPFFGVERKGSPVYGFLRMSKTSIRINSQIYEPSVILVFDKSLIKDRRTMKGIQENGTVIINTKDHMLPTELSSKIRTLASVDASSISRECFGKNIPNTAMLGAFARITNLVDINTLLNIILKTFGENNMKAAIRGYEEVTIIKGE